MSAAIRVVGPRRTDFLPDGTRIDIRVDHHDEPLAELRRLVEVGNAHRVLAQLVFAPGLVAGTADVRCSVPEVLSSLAEAQRVLAGDYEPTFWQGVLAWRDGRYGQGRALLVEAVAGRPQFRQFLQSLATAGLLELPASGVAGLLAEPRAG